MGGGILDTLISRTSATIAYRALFLLGAAMLVLSVIGFLPLLTPRHADTSAVAVTPASAMPPPPVPLASSPSFASSGCGPATWD